MTAKVARKEKRAQWIASRSGKSFQRWKEDLRRAEKQARLQEVRRATPTHTSEEKGKAYL